MTGAPTRPAALRGSGRAGGKTILLGEHAVVYGAPAVAIPVPDLQIRVDVGPGEGWDLRADGVDPDGVDRAALDRARDAQLALLGWSGPPPGIRVRASLPPSCGLGSSAALGVALARALLAATGEGDTPDRVRELADASEHVFHERPSGVDVATVLAGTPIRFRRGETPRPVHVRGRFDLFVVDTEVRSRTSDVVAAVAARRGANPGETATTMDDLARHAAEGADALERGDPAALAAAMTGAMEGLRTLDVSHPAIEGVVDAALQAGAGAAKLSGAGRGGIVLLLAPAPEWSPGPAVDGHPVLTRITLG